MTHTPVQQQLISAATALIDRGFRVAPVKVGWDAAKAKKRYVSGPSEDWHLRPPLSASAFAAAVTRGANAYLYRLPDGWWVLDADSAETRAWCRQQLGDHDVLTGSGVGAHWIVGEQAQPAKHLDTAPRQLYGPGSHYLRGDGSMALYTGSVPMVPRPLPAAFPRKAAKAPRTAPSAPGEPSFFDPAPMTSEQAKAKAAEFLRAIETGPEGGAEARDGVMRAALFLGGLLHTGLFDDAQAFDLVATACAARWGEADDDDAKWIEQGIGDGRAKPLTVRERVSAPLPFGEGAAAVDALALWPHQETDDVWNAPGDVTDAAQRFRDMWSHDGVLTVRYWRGDWWRWNGVRWAVTARDEVESQLYRHLVDKRYIRPAGEGTEVKEVPWNPSPKSVTSVLAGFQFTHALLPNALEDNAWIDGRDTARLVGTPDGLFDPAARTVQPATPEYLNTWALPYSFDAAAPPPLGWLRFLDAVGMDPGDKLTLQEWFGYLVSGRTDLQKGVFLQGPKRSGKGTILRVATALVGQAATVGLKLKDMARNFGLERAIGAALLTDGDVREASLTPHEASDVVTKLLSIIGEDGVQVDRKNRTAWTGRLPGRVMLASNDALSLHDSTATIGSRFLMLHTSIGHFGREDPQLFDRLAGELPGILNWALDGLDRLTAQGRFTESERARAAQATSEHTQSRMLDFLDRLCVPNPLMATKVSALYELWKAWCRVEEIGRPGSSQQLSAKLTAAWTDVHVGQPRRNDGTNPRAFVGVGINLAAVHELVADARIVPVNMAELERAAC